MWREKWESEWATCTVRRFCGWPGSLSPQAKLGLSHSDCSYTPPFCFGVHTLTVFVIVTLNSYFRQSFRVQKRQRRRRHRRRFETSQIDANLCVEIVVFRGPTVAENCRATPIVATLRLNISVSFKIGKLLLKRRRRGLAKSVSNVGLQMSILKFVFLLF